VVFWLPCHAQEAAKPAEVEQAFQDLLADLSNPEKSYRYAQLAVQAGDIRGAIASLERLLRLNPNLDNIRLELGVLYYRLGSTDLALSYMRQAVKSPDIPPEIKHRAEEYIATAERQASPERFSGSLSLLGRYDTNVNLGPSSANIAGGTLNPEATAHSDFSVVLAGSAQYLRDLGLQDYSRLEVNGTAYVQRYKEQDDFNIGLAQLDIGPGMQVGDIDSRPIFLRPYATGLYLGLGDESYLSQFGGGLTVTLPVSADFAIHLNGEGSFLKFYNSDFRPTATDQTGPEARGVVTLTYAIAQNQQIELIGGYVRDDAEKSFEAHDDRRIMLSYSIGLESPIRNVKQPWLVTLGTAYFNLDYDSPDPHLPGTPSRHDDRFQVSLTTAFPISDSWAIIAAVGYTRNNSNVEFDDYDNVDVFTGIEWTF